jgi:hypothetical protein
MAQRAAYLVKAHSIPPELMVNSDQTGIHLIPTGGARTWAEKGSKHVLVHGQDDKRQITVSVSSSAAGDLLPFQAIFTGTTYRCLPPQNEGRELCEEAGWHLTYSSNHWSNLDTCKDFVKKILEPYRVKQVQQMGLDDDSKLLWLLNCWSVHISHEFTNWLKEVHPIILLIFVPANCTSVYQPADVILQRPFKHGFRQEFDNYSTECISKQLDEKALKDVKLDTKMTVLKPLLCSWLFQAWHHVNQLAMIRKGWTMCGLDRAFNKSFQTTAMDEHMRNPLFKEKNSQAEEISNEREDETDTDVNNHGREFDSSSGDSSSK